LLATGLLACHLVSNAKLALQLHMPKLAGLPCLLPELLLLLLLQTHMLGYGSSVHLHVKGLAGVDILKVLWQQVPGQVLLAACRTKSLIDRQGKDFVTIAF
jgi:hypothetical protein